MAVIIDSRIAGANGNIRTECVKNMNGLLETAIQKHIVEIMMDGTLL